LLRKEEEGGERIPGKKGKILGKEQGKISLRMRKIFLRPGGGRRTSLPRERKKKKKDGEKATRGGDQG